ncbi:MAG: zinc-ribbon domain-containing protein [Phycisphaerales bacterium]|nr:MAG: zinc-ribbon domain-containing protein [Phycisphaerales bacterium]
MRPAATFLGVFIMIIWGSKGREKIVARGQFHCPKCRTDAEYTHRRVSRCFTLYFIPLFTLETLGEYGLCHHCGVQLPAELLMLTREQVDAAWQPWQCVECSNVNSAEVERCVNCGAAPPASSHSENGPDTPAIT